MKHARRDTLKTLAPLLRALRKRDILKEKSTGVFYLKSKAFLHFHDDSTGIFADVKLDLANYSRCRATTRREQEGLLRRIDKSLSLIEFRRATAK